MSNISPDEETLEFAVAREIDSYHFYMALSVRAESAGMRKVFEDLAKEELEHKAKLELEIIKTGRTVSIDRDMDGTGQKSALYDFAMELDMDYKGLLLMAIEKEEAAFRTYINLLQQTKNDRSREILLTLAEEEVKHKMRFEIEYEMLLKNADTHENEDL